MPAVVVDSSVLISLAAGEQFHLLQTIYSTIYILPEVWREVSTSPKPFGARETQEGLNCTDSPQSRSLNKVGEALLRSRMTLVAGAGSYFD
jgi:predicted nucleic acid-binding protein